MKEWKLELVEVESENSGNVKLAYERLKTRIIRGRKWKQWSESINNQRPDNKDMRQAHWKATWKV